MNLQDRIRAFINHKGLTIQQFEMAVPLSNGAVSKMGDNTRRSTLEKISEKFPEINISWLLTGEGSMLTTAPHVPFESNATISERKYVEVEFVDLRASAGMQSGFGVEQNPDRVTRLVHIDDADPSNYIVVRVNGISMDDGTTRSIVDGSELLARRIERLEEMRIRAKLYCIFSQSGDVVKQIVEVNTQKGYLMCHSFNASYEDFEIPIEEIYHIFEICSEINRPIML